MQVKNDELRAQQLVLAFLGFYKGAIDGIWSDASISAMRAFECAESFPPAVPSNGLPFPYGSRLPKGMFWQGRQVNHTKMTAEKAAEILAARTKKVVETPKQEEVEAKVETVAPVAEPVVTESSAPVEPASAPAPQVQQRPQQNQHQQQRQQHQQNQKR